MTLKLERQEKLEIGGWYAGQIDGQARLLRVTEQDSAGIHGVLADSKLSLLDFVVCRVIDSTGGQTSIELSID